MRDLFLCLLVNLKNHGNITSASMWEELSSITLVNGKDEYSISIRKDTKKEDTKDD